MFLPLESLCGYHTGIIEGRDLKSMALGNHLAKLCENLQNASKAITSSTPSIPNPDT